MALPSAPAGLVNVNAPLVPALGVTLTVIDDAPIPAEFVAATEQDHAVPLVSDVTVSGLDAPVVVRVAPPAAQETV